MTIIILLKKNITVIIISLIIIDLFGEHVQNFEKDMLY